MNTKVREYLINTARTKDKFVFYSDVVKDCNLGFNLDTKYGQHQLSEVLGDVSTYEYKQHRPLISSLAIYKNERVNDHGEGFYKLAQQLGKGKAKELRERLYAFEEAAECRVYWQNEDHYSLYGNIDVIDTPGNKPEFFTQAEIDFFKKWQYRSYNPKLNEHINAKNHLMNTVWQKSIYLGQQLVNTLEGFQSAGKKYWSQRGWTESDGINVQAAIFKPYTWIKVYRNTDKGKDIFFTFGIDVHPNTDAFVYKIDCQRTRDSKLNNQQINLFDNLIPNAAKWNSIPFPELLSGNWDVLIATCNDFINTYINQYDAVVSSLWGAEIPPDLFKNTLVWRDKPKNGLSEVPNKTKTFQGIEVDFQERAEEQKDLGDAGEALVKASEIKWLKWKNRNDLALKVEIVKDGKGYDVLSFDELGNNKYIEVKTTTGNEYAPFYLSDNEVEFMRRYKNQYHIYRIFRYDAENNFGECYAISSNVEEQLLLKPISYQVYLKKDS